MDQLREALQRVIRANKALGSIRQCEDESIVFGLRCELVEGHELLAGTPHRAKKPDSTVRVEW